MFGLRDEVIREIGEIAQRYHVQRVRIFGSRARGDHRERSDIDLAAEGGDIASFAVDVEEDTSTLLKYDIVDMNRPVQPELMDSIQREGIVIYEKV